MAKKRRAHAHAHPALTFFHVSTRIIRIRLHAYTRFFVSFRALLSFRQSRVCARTRSHVRTVGGDRTRCETNFRHSDRFKIENLRLKIFTWRIYVSYMRIYANKRKAILYYVFLIFFKFFTRRKTRWKKKERIILTFSKLYMTEFTKHLFHQLYHSERKSKKKQKKKKNQRCEEKMRVAQFSRAKNFSSSLTLFFFSFLFFFPFISALSFTSGYRGQSSGYQWSRVHRFLARLRRSTI